MIKFKITFLLIFYFVFFTICIHVDAQQISIPRVEQMPNQPTPYLMRDWKQVTIDYDKFVFDFNKTGQYLPLIERDSNGINYPGRDRFWLHSYVGTKSPESGEAINALPAVISASLVGIDKSDQDGNNWVLMCEEWFNRRPTENVYLNGFSASSGSDWWYETMPNVFFYQLYDLYPGTGDFEYQFTTVADRWLQAAEHMGGSSTPWKKPFMNYRAWYLSDMTPNTETPTEPEAAGAIGWLLYNAYKVTGEPKYRIGAEWCLEFLNEWDSNPSYELQLPYGAHIAARMNAQLGTEYDVEKLVNWCFTPQGNVRNWGVTLRRWGDYDCYGLVGEAKYDGYAFIMNGFEMVGALVPMVRYDDRFARAIGKWVLNAANASRLFYPKYLPDENQDSEAWAHQYDSLSVIAHESMREFDLHNPNISPFATGDAVRGGWGNTNLALYGSSHVGIFGGIIDTTNIPMILQLDLLKTDYFHDQAYPSYLYYNPYQEEKTVELDVGSGVHDIYDAVQNSFISTGVTGQTTINIPADGALLAVIAPSGGTVSYDLNRMLIDGVVVDYRSENIVANYPPRIKSLDTESLTIEIGDSVLIYCAAEDHDQDTLTFSWQVDSGQITVNANMATWLPPQTPGNYQISCVVTDVNSGKDSAYIHIEVVESINQLPSIASMQASQRKIDLQSETQIFCSASDPDGDSLSYLWSADAGTITGSDSSVTWKAPDIEGNYYITCRVEDGLGGVVEDSIGVVVRDFSTFEKGKLVAYYPLDGNSNDLSGNGHDGTVHGAVPTEDRSGNSNSAFYFDGANDYVQIPNHDSLNFREAISINFWMRVDELLTREAFTISHGSWQNRWKVSIIPKPDNRVRWTINTGEGIVDLDSDLQVKTGLWYNVTTFYDGSDFELYINGQLNSFSTWSGLINTTTYDLTVGQMLPNNSSYNFKGALDDIRIYDYGLSVEEIKNLYQGSTAIKPDKKENIPEQFILYQNYPNPFNPTTTIHFALPQKQHVRIIIYNIRGQIVANLVDRNFTAGEYDVKWDATGFASGLYFYQIQSEHFTQTKKLILMR